MKTFVNGAAGMLVIALWPLSSAYFPLPGPRARSEVSRNYKLDLLCSNIMRSWDGALEDYIKNYWLPK